MADKKISKNSGKVVVIEDISQSRKLEAKLMKISQVFMILGGVLTGISMILAGVALFAGWWPPRGGSKMKQEDTYLEPEGDAVAES